MNTTMYLAILQIEAIERLDAENKRLRAGILALIDGSPEHQPSKKTAGLCIHSHWDDDGVCDQCLDDYLRDLLDGAQK